MEAVQRKSRKSETVRGRRKRGRKRNGRDIVRIMYANINGQSRKLWMEIEERAKKTKADVVCLVETHWRMGHRGKKLGGYRRYWRRREAGERKGGGIAVFVKEDLRVAEWNRRDVSEEENKELMWIQIKGSEMTVAVGVMYMALDRYRESNDKLEREVTEDVAKLKQEGKMVVLLGDANGHIHEEDGGVEGITTRTDANGMRILRLVREAGLEIVNRTTKCKA